MHLSQPLCMHAVQTGQPRVAEALWPLLGPSQPALHTVLPPHKQREHAQNGDGAAPAAAEDVPPAAQQLHDQVSTLHLLHDPFCCSSMSHTHTGGCRCATAGFVSSTYKLRLTEACTVESRLLLPACSSFMHGILLTQPCRQTNRPHVQVTIILRAQLAGHPVPAHKKLSAWLAESEVPSQLGGSAEVLRWLMRSVLVHASTHSVGRLDQVCSGFKELVHDLLEQAGKEEVRGMLYAAAPACRHQSAAVRHAGFDVLPP